MTYNFNITPIFQVEIKDGRSRMSDEEFSRYQKFLLSNNGPRQMYIEKPKKSKSLKQLAYYWGVVVQMIAWEIGEENQHEVSAYLKAMFLSKPKTIGGKEIMIVGRISKLNSEQMAIFLDKVIMWASKTLNIVIPDPDPDYQNRVVLVEKD